MLIYLIMLDMFYMFSLLGICFSSRAYNVYVLYAKELYS